MVRPTVSGFPPRSPQIFAAFLPRVFFSLLLSISRPFCLKPKIFYLTPPFEQSTPGLFDLKEHDSSFAPPMRRSIGSTYFTTEQDTQTLGIDQLTRNNVAVFAIGLIATVLRASISSQNDFDLDVARFSYDLAETRGSSSLPVPATNMQAKLARSASVASSARLFETTELVPVGIAAAFLRSQSGGEGLGQEATRGPVGRGY